MSNLSLAILLFLQLAVIIGTCRLVGWLGRRFLGQTQVVMEMVAGVLLGPSLFGVLAPELQAQLFPKQLVLETAQGTVAVAHPAMMVLYFLAQIGLVLYMFLIGLEFDVRRLKGQGGTAVSVSAAGVIAPFGLGILVAMWLHGTPGHVFFTDRVSLLGAILFVGSAISITAFPMLARILYERGISRTRMGTLTLTAGSMDDALAWCFLAVVLATLEASPKRALMAVGGGLIYGLFMMLIARRWLAKLGERTERQGGLSFDTYTFIVLLVMVCAFITDGIGIYAVFGAFICGAALPKGRFAEWITERTEQLTTALFLPIFFVYSGLNTKIGLVNTPWLWFVTAVVILASIAGKGVACTLAARYGGLSWRDSLSVGTLMNARGLMELILLNIGLEHGAITPTYFTIMVMMAVVTTLMASPLYNLIARPAEELLRETAAVERA